jgi:hypothetical protein
LDVGDISAVPEEFNQGILHDEAVYEDYWIVEVFNVEANFVQLDVGAVKAVPESRKFE